MCVSRTVTTCTYIHGNPALPQVNVTVVVVCAVPVIPFLLFGKVCVMFRFDTFTLIHQVVFGDLL